MLLDLISPVGLGCVGPDRFQSPACGYVCCLRVVGLVGGVPNSWEMAP